MISIINLKIKDSKIYEKGIYTFLNPFSYTVARNNKELISKFDGIYIDGEYLKKFLRLFCGLKVNRASFDMTSLAPKVFEWCEENNKSIGFIGSKEDEILNAVEVIQRAYPKLSIKYSHHGYLKSTSIRNNCLNSILALDLDVVIVGMGTPLQEKFLVDLWNSGWRGLGFTCGGFFHQTGKKLVYYPRFIDKYNLRWMYRIYDEPKLFKRYAIEYPKFVCLFLRDYLKFKKDKAFQAAR